MSFSREGSSGAETAEGSSRALLLRFIWLELLYLFPFRDYLRWHDVWALLRSINNTKASGWKSAVRGDVSMMSKGGKGSKWKFEALVRLFICVFVVGLRFLSGLEIFEVKDPSRSIFRLSERHSKWQHNLIIHFKAKQVAVAQWWTVYRYFSWNWVDAIKLEALLMLSCFREPQDCKQWRIIEFLEKRIRMVVATT